jgi:hypothetical protein
MGRAIPASREGLRQMLDALGVPNVHCLLLKSHGLSLADHYWIKEKDQALSWKDINFFMNGFSPDVGNLLFGERPVDIRKVDLVSPDIASDGLLKKKWIISDDKRILVKGFYDAYFQEPFNEAVASDLMDELGIDHVKYFLAKGDKDYFYSMCECFVTSATEFVPALRIRASLPKDDSEDPYAHFLNCCKVNGIPDPAGALDKMLALDYLINNEDRHWGNFGFVRDANTLEWIKFAPLFDSGTSLWCSEPLPTIGQTMFSAPFRGSHEEQIALVGDLDWLDTRLFDEKLGHVVRQGFAHYPSTYSGRVDAIIDAVSERGRSLHGIQARLGSASRVFVGGDARLSWRGKGGRSDAI